MADKNRNLKLKKTQKSLTRFFKDIKNELKKVIWPDRKQLTNNTITVLLFCLIVGSLIWIFDVVFKFLAGIVFTG